MELKIYDLTIDSQDPESSGMYGMSFVQVPAVLTDFLCFSEDKPLRFAVQNEEQKIVTGIAMLADTPIFRVANRVIPEDHYVVFSKATIKQMVQKFFKENKIGNMSLDHETPFEDAYLFESYMTDTERGINAPNEFKNIPDGSWITSYKITNDNLWQGIKEGMWRGFSIEGYFDYADEVQTDNPPAEELETMMKAIYKDLCKAKLDK